MSLTKNNSRNNFVWGFLTRKNKANYRRDMEIDTQVFILLKFMVAVCKVPKTSRAVVGMPRRFSSDGPNTTTRITK